MSQLTDKLHELIEENIEGFNEDGMLQAEENPVDVDGVPEAADAIEKYILANYIKKPL